MKSNLRNRSTLLIVGAALLASASCGDRIAPTNPATTDLRKPSFEEVTGGGTVATITRLHLSSKKVGIGGPGTNYKVQVNNATTVTQPGIVLQGELVQGATTRAAGGFIAFCPNPDGTLPVGKCTMTFTVNAADDGTLVPGPANFVLTLSQSEGSASRILDSRTVAVTLVGPSITSVDLSPKTLPINGPDATYTVNVDNPTGAILPNVFLQGVLIQGATSKGAGGFIAHCPTPDGNLPTGACAMSFTIHATGDGSFVPGPATFVLTLAQTVGSTTITFDSKTIAVTLVQPSITKLTLASTIVDIGGPGANYTVKVNNPTGSIQPGVILQGYLVQGSTQRAAGGFIANCPTPDQNLPIGNCTMGFTIDAPDDGSLVAGPATFLLVMTQTAFGTTRTLDQASVAVTLQGTGIISLVLSKTKVKIGGEGTVYTTTVLNSSGAIIPNVVLQGFLVQNGTTAAAGGVIANCPTVDANLPRGLCTMTFTVNATGNGSLVAGPATFVLDLIAGSTTLDSKTAAVTLVP